MNSGGFKEIASGDLGKRHSRDFPLSVNFLGVIQYEDERTSEKLLKGIEDPQTN